MHHTSLATAVFLSLASTACLAQESILLEKNIAVSANSELHINIPVGELRLESYAGQQVQLQIEVKESKTKSWFSSADLSEVELSQQQDQQKLQLSVAGEDVTQKWTVKVPQHVDLDLAIGVGDALLVGINADLGMDIGVGSAEVKLAHDNYSRISLDAGVGDAKLKSFQNVEVEKALVSTEVDWQGTGKYNINVDVGVGDVQVSLD